MRKLIALALLLLPSPVLADRLGGLSSNADVALSTQVETSAITMVFDGGGSVLAAGVEASTTCVMVPFSATVSSWTVIVPPTSDSGSISVTIRKASYANFGTFSAMSNGGNAPSLTSASKNTAIPSGWASTSITAGDTVCGQITSATSVERVSVSLWLTR